MAQLSIEPTRRYEGTVEYQKTKQHATILDFNYPEKDLENALEDIIKETEQQESELEKIKPCSPS